MAIFDIEYTDTFGGEANYCWVDRYTIRVDSDSRGAVMRAAKKAAGLAGVRGRTVEYGDMFDFRPYRSATVLFVTWHDCGQPGGCDACKPLRTDETPKNWKPENE